MHETSVELKILGIPEKYIMLSCTDWLTQKATSTFDTKNTHLQKCLIHRGITSMVLSDKFIYPQFVNTELTHVHVQVSSQIWVKPEFFPQRDNITIITSL